VAAVYGPFLYYESQAMPTTLAITLALASLVALAEWAERPRGVWLVVSGLAAGFLVLTRPSFLVWVAVAACWVVGRRGLRRGAQALLCFVLPAALVIAPVSLRNYLRSSAWVLVSANGGINFFLGNNPDAARTALLRPGLQWEELVASPPDSARAGQARWDRWFAARGVTWVREHPLGFVAGLVEKSVQYANAHEIDRNLDVRGFKEQSRVLRLAPTYALVAPWVLLGLVVAWRRKGAARLAVLFWLANAAATVLFFVTERYRLDAAPAAIVLAVSAARAARAALRNPEDHPTIDGSATAWRLPLGWVMGLLAAGTVLAFGNFYGIHDIHPADAAQLEGMAYYKEGRYGMAIDRLREALRRNPNDSDAHYQLGTALQKQNHLREALAEYESAHRIAPRSPEPLVNAGWVLRELGEKAPALERYRAASGLRPADASLRLEVGLLEENLGDLDAARASYETILRLAADPAVQRAAREHLAGLERRGAPSPH
jgi:tetratricopeptide (TPR) repeat protein